MEGSEASGRARSFGSEAAAYARARPTYALEAVRWVLPRVPCRVVDVGAGTGKLTEVVAALGGDVVAVEPLAEMRRHLAAALPAVEVLPGAAEDLPLADRSVDAVVAGQAYHWFDGTRFLSEAARVLRPGGTLGLLWNSFDDTVEWVDALAWLIDEDDRRTLLDEVEPFAAAGFDAPKHCVAPHTTTLTVDGLVDLVASRSRTITLPDDDRSELLDRVRRFAVSHPALRGRDSFEAPYVTDAWRAVALPPPNGES